MNMKMNNMHEDKKFSRKFGGKLTKYTQVPNALLIHQAHLDISNVELVVLVHLLSFKFDSRDPYPSREKIANRMKIEPDSLTRIVRGLKKKGYLNTKRRFNSSNVYDLSPLVDKLQVFDKLDNKRVRNVVSNTSKMHAPP